MNEQEHHHVVVVGAGAAGAAAALFIARAGISVTMVDNGRSTLKRASLENVPGMKTITGELFRQDAVASATSAGAFYTEAAVTVVRPTGHGFVVSLGETRLWATHVILATGQGSLKMPTLDLRRTEPLQPYVKVNLVVDADGRTSYRGVWAAGVITGCPSQVVVCAGSGARAALSVISEIKGEYWVDHDSV